MATKKVSLKEFNELVTKMVRAEIKNALKEDMDHHLKKVKDKEKMSAWLMRQYFNPEKHASKIWYDRAVDQDNVLEYISDSFNNFPLTPKEISELWKLKNSLGSSMKTISKELDSVPDEEEKPKGAYQTGEVTLKDIGDELGGLTPTMINKLVSSGMEKIKSMTGGKPPWNMDSEDLEDLTNKIALARVDTARAFANELKSSNGDIEAFLEKLSNENVLASSDLAMVGERERSGLKTLSDMPVERIIKFLLGDIERDDNTFKSFQAAVSRRVFPPARRGRPRKEV